LRTTSDHQPPAAGYLSCPELSGQESNRMLIQKATGPSDRKTEEVLS
jgi:hypothetical protein